MRQICPDLWQTSREHPIPGRPDVVSHAYLLLRDKGNVLFYNTGREAVGAVSDEGDLRRIEELGGIGHQFLGHWHEASASLDPIRRRFGSKLVVHRDDARAVERETGAEPDELIEGRGVWLEDIEAIPTPGHTAGSVSYLYRSPHGRSYLFTGDAIVPSGDSWTAAPLEESDRGLIKASLALFGQLEPDVVIAAAALDTDTLQEVSKESWRSAIAAAERTVDRETV
jgi:glyoxylase-like metal-dependent hydrolase (beta-lactamase superfamily II)